MDPLIGAAIAAMVGWLSILVAIQLPWRPDPASLRWAGAGALALVALMVWGAPVPPWSPLVVLAVGLVWGSLRPRARNEPSP